MSASTVWDLSNISSPLPAPRASSGSTSPGAAPPPAPVPAETPVADLPSILTADEVAALLRVDRKTIYEAVKDGTLPALRLRRVIRFNRNEVLRWFVAAGRRTP